MRYPIVRAILTCVAAAALLALGGCDKSDLLAPDTGQLILIATPESVTLDPGDSSASATVNLSAQIFDDAGYPLVGAKLTFFASSGRLASAAPDGSAQQVETDDNGTAHDTLTVTLADDDQITITARSGTLQQTVTVSKTESTGNQPPVADITTQPASPQEAGNFATFRGTGSFDPDGDAITCYQWEVLSTVSANDRVIQGPTRSSFTKRYDVEQVLTVTLRVSDEANDGFCVDCDAAPGACGASTSRFSPDDFTVTYEFVCDPTAPVARGPADQTIQLSGGSAVVALADAGSSDPESGISSTSWNCGNGTGNQPGTSVVCTYTSAGTYFAALTVVNGCGQTSSDQVRITVTSP